MSLVLKCFLLVIIALGRLQRCGEVLKNGSEPVAVDAVAMTATPLTNADVAHDIRTMEYSRSKTDSIKPHTLKALFSHSGGVDNLD